MGGLFSSRHGEQFGDALFISQKLRNAAWMLSSIPDLRSAFIQYLKDKKWVHLYLERLLLESVEVDDSISMAVKYNFPTELLRCFPGLDGTSPGSKTLDPVDLDDSSIKDYIASSTHQQAKDSAHHPSLLSMQSSVFMSTSSLLSQCTPSNSTLIQSTIQQELKLLVIAGILLIYVDSSEYKRWIRHHMSLVTFTELCQQELEYSLRSLRNLRPRSISMSNKPQQRSQRRKVHPGAPGGNSPSSVQRKYKTNTGTPTSDKKKALLQSTLPANSPGKGDHETAASAQDALEHISSGGREVDAGMLQQQYQQQLRAKRKHEHNERLKKVIFSALSIPFTGGHSLRHVLSTSDWLNQLVHFLQFVPIGLQIASSSSYFFHHFRRHHPHAHGGGQREGICCRIPREICPVLYVNRQGEIVHEIPQDEILGHSLGQMLAHHYLVHAMESPPYPHAIHHPSLTPSVVMQAVGGSNTNAATHGYSSVTSPTENSSSASPSTRQDEVGLSSKQNNNSNSKLQTAKSTKLHHDLYKGGGSSSAVINDEQQYWLRRIKDLERQVMQDRRAGCMTYRLLHFDGLYYWHFVKCLPVFHTLSDLLGQPGGHEGDGHAIGVNMALDNEEEFAHVWDIAQQQARSEKQKSTKSEEHIREDMSPDFDVADGLLHVLTSHIAIKDVVPAKTLPADSSASVGGDVETGDGTIQSSPFAIRGYTLQEMEQLAMDLQSIDDFLLILSALF